jgi:3'-5' exoribonuclease 1
MIEKRRNFFDPLLNSLNESLEALEMDATTTGAEGKRLSKNRRRRERIKLRLALERERNDASGSAAGSRNGAGGGSEDSEDEAPFVPFSDAELARIQAHMAARGSIDKKQKHEFYAVFDVEATCERNVDKPFEYPNEIIEWPVVLFDGRTHEVVAEFQSYVKPTSQPILSDFCKELTGIAQETVDSAPPFTKVLANFEQWLSHFDDTGPKFENTVFITDGPWDLRDFVEKQCRISSIKRPKYLYAWCDLRTVFADWKKTSRLNIDGMLAALNLRFEGRPHSGIDDARNIALIVQHLAEAGVKFEANGEVFKKKRTKRK